GIAKGRQRCNAERPATRKGRPTMSTLAYHVPSASRPGVTYLVTYRLDRGLECDCPDSIHRRRECKHQRAVLRGEVEPDAPPAPFCALADLYPDGGAALDRALAARRAVAS